jgi:hypothetical protein
MHTASIDFSKAALDRVKRLARHPESASMLTTLVVKPADRKSESSGFGGGLDWKRLGNSALDMNQDAVRDWVDALRCLSNSRVVRTGRSRARNLSIRWDPGRSGLKDYEALAIAMLFINVTKIPVESLDLCTVDFWDLDSNY